MSKTKIIIYFILVALDIFGAITQIFFIFTHGLLLAVVAFDLYEYVSKRIGEKKNFFVSPFWFILTALGILVLSVEVASLVNPHFLMT